MTEAAASGVIFIGKIITYIRVCGTIEGRLKTGGKCINDINSSTYL